MSVLKVVTYDGFAERAVAIGDTLAAAEVLPVANASLTPTITGQMLFGGFIQRTIGAAATDTIDTAANMVAAINGGLGFAGIQNGTTVRVRWLVTGGFAVTVQATANTGVTVTGGAIAAGAASSWKEFLVTVVNGSPAVAGMGLTLNASPIVTGMTLAQTAVLSPGMIVTNAVNNLQGTTILSVQSGIGVTLSGNANATAATPVGISFSPQITVVSVGAGSAL